MWDRGEYIVNGWVYGWVWGTVIGKVRQWGGGIVKNGLDMSVYTRIASKGIDT